MKRRKYKTVKIPSVNTRDEKNNSLAKIALSLCIMDNFNVNTKVLTEEVYTTVSRGMKYVG